ATKASKTKGYTGSGYLEAESAPSSYTMQGNYNAPKTGTYILELRYAMQDGEYPAEIKVNGKEAGELVLWTTGGPSTWAWDQKPIHLNEGENEIRITATGAPKIDHLNILFGSVNEEGIK
ncbi:carbohydrate-binding protein, partial [bacterium]|nr:carbohydrate-binding protein [bacterium]